MNEAVNITPKQYDIIADIQQQILDQLASDEPAIAILNSLCLFAESVLANAVASIMLLDEGTGLLNVLCAPSLSQKDHEALANLKPGSSGGSCGNAVFHNEALFVQNTFEDERWRDRRHVAFNLNLCSCWSMPVRDESGQAIGSFSLSSFEHRAPTSFHKKVLEIGAAIVNIVLKRQQKEERLNLLLTVIDSASEGVVITDSNNNIIEVNPAFERIYGFSEQEVLGKNPKILSSGLQDEIFYQKLWQALKIKGKWRGEITNKRRNGDYVTQWMSITAIKNEQGELQHYLSIFCDLTELKTTQQQIIDMAFYDTTTGLHNKTSLEQQVEDRDCNHALILLNINNFNYLNTAYGFNVGDQVLKVIGKMLSENFASGDAFRLNSDEFALLFAENIDIDKQIKAIQAHFYNTLIEVGDISLHIAFTYGAVYGKENLLRNCALALKEAKRLGKNRYHIFDANTELPDNSSRDHFIASNHILHTAFEKNQFIPYFQGIYDNKSKRIHKFEVLARINDGDKILAPHHFLETAKLSGLLPEITRVMIDKSFKIMAENDYDFSLNITEDDLSQNYLLAYLQQKVRQYSIQPTRIILEILEGVSATGKKNHTRQLLALKSQGYAIAIDDFGTEYSNFERILDLDIDYLKIDARYIKNIDVSEKSYEITRAITFFAHNANIPCIAEFVHSESVQNVVNNLAIDYSQGYHFSEPAPFPIAS